MGVWVGAGMAAGWRLSCLNTARQTLNTQYVFVLQPDGGGGKKKSVS